MLSRAKPGKHIPGGLKPNTNNLVDIFEVLSVSKLKYLDSVQLRERLNPLQQLG